MNRKILKPLAIFMALNMLWEIVCPTLAFALTGGPSQPEMESFEPVGTSDMVDLFSGDFNYNIPLMDVGGYPINIAYHSGITMDQEASWTGLGWNINAGVINRVMRGIPDDFDNEAITNETNIRDNITWSLFASPGIELFGYSKNFKNGTNKDDSLKNVSKLSLSLKLGMTQNNYRGRGYFFGASFNIPFNNADGDNQGGLQLGFNGNSQGGFEYDVSFNRRTKSGGSWGLGTGINSRTGMKDLTINSSKQKTMKTFKKMSEEQQTAFNADPRMKYQQGIYNNSIPLNPAAEPPTLNHSFNTYVQNYNLSAGGELWGLHLNIGLGGTYSSTELSSRNVSRGAYGYLYAQNASQNDDALHDFSRERDGNLNQYIKNLPLSAASYDILSVSGQGTGGMFRPHRNSNGVFYDNVYDNYTSNLATLGVELGFGNLFHIGLNYTPTVSKETSGPWTTLSGNFIKNTHNFTGASSSDPLFERVYYQSGGEKVPMDQAYYNNLGGDRAGRLNIVGMGPLYFALATNALEDDNHGIGVVPAYNNNTQRQARAQHIQMLTAQESKSGIGYMPRVRSYPANYYDMTTPTYTDYDRTTQTPAKSGHIGEIVQTNPDGMRYVYAIPAYNNFQDEVCFNIKGNATYPSKGLTDYETGKDNSSKNWRGPDHYFNKTHTPAFAHSYLLTAVLSADYVDSDMDGKPSEGDIGQYVVFNYTRKYTDYNWRVPAEAGKAQFQEGLKSDPDDDKGNYIYGTKEIWYLQSIESRTHIAEFKTSPRLDGLGVVGENGGKNVAKPLMKLDTIVLYSRPDKIQNKAAATPIKKIVFEYDYSLCKQVPNNKYADVGGAVADSTGKLTLKKLYFLYGNSGKGAMSPYKFTYANNYNYSMADYDRWGNYKPNNEQLPNRDFPYTDQTASRSALDQYASAWTLNKVELPSGGTIEATYEADDYAFVQDRKAMQMVQVIGATDDGGISGFRLNQANSDKLYTSGGDNRNNYLIFKLPAGVSNATDLSNKCFANIDQLYFKFLVNVKGKWEYIAGWCAIDKSQIGIVNSDHTLGYVKVRSVDQGDWLMHTHDDVNPIAKATWQFAKANMSKALNPGSDPNSTGVGAFQGLLQAYGEAFDMFRGQYQALKSDEVASQFNTAKSWIRIENANMAKCGGGCRVKQLSFSDSWNQMDEFDKQGKYEQVYDYTKNDDVYGVISSGVASYEPIIGGEENPFRKPIKYMQDNNFSLPALELYHEEPFGESFFPAPGVGYSKVTVKNKAKTGVRRTGTGRTEYEFYTARDFPVKLQQTQLHPESLGAGRAGTIISSFLKVVSMSYFAASQGYAVKLNDMHGKPSAVTIYSEMDQSPLAPVIISKVSYKYQVKNGELDNQVKVLNSLGKIEDAVIGKEIDVSVDMRQNERWEINAGIQGNIKIDLAGIFPVAYAIPWPSFKYSLSRTQSASVTKIIQQYGILESTTVQDEGSIITTKNVLYDKLSGQVLLTQTENMFHDPLYNFTYLAHMAYDGMGAAYKNAGMSTAVSMNSQGDAQIGKGLFVEGDELMLTASNGTVVKGWVLRQQPFSASLNTITVINNYGSPIAGAFTAKVIRSGRRNQLVQPVAQVSSTTNPITADSITYGNGLVINASASTFSDKWNMRISKTNVWVSHPYYDHFITCIPPQPILGEPRDSDIYEDRDTVYVECLCYDCKGDKWLPYISQAYVPQEDEHGDIHYIYDKRTDNCPPVQECYRYVLNDKGEYIIQEGDTLKAWQKTQTQISCDTTYVHDSAFKETVSVQDTIGWTAEYCYPDSAYNPGYVLECKYTLANTATGYPYINPYVSGHYGNWRPQKSMAFVEDRKYLYQKDTTFIRKDGLYKSYAPYWYFNSTGFLSSNADKRWVASTTVTNYHHVGAAAEARDALGNYSAELYGYKEKFVTATSSFAKVSDIANDNFEDFTTLNTGCSGAEGHWSFEYGNNAYDGSLVGLPSPEGDPATYLAAFITSTTAHSGVQSICVPPGVRRSVDRVIDTTLILTPPATTFFNVKNVANTLYRFAPDKGKKYYLSAWVKGRNTAVNAVNTFDSAWVRVSIGGATPINVVFKPSGPIIEGWQRVEGTFTVPLTADYINVSLENNSRYKAYFDDIRIHPFQSNMKTFVYHPISQKVMAALDENNFASFYEYNAEGKLIRIKKETERGIMTIQESRGSQTKMHP